MFFQSAGSRARAVAFDALVAKTNQVLGSSAVAQALGERATRLLAVNTEAFLPNFRDNVVALTFRQRRSDAIGILPLTEAERLRGVVLSESALLPLSSKLRALERANSYAAHGLRSAIFAMATYGRIPPRKPHTADANTLSICYPMPNVGITMESRPLIVTHDTTAGLAAPYVAALMGHEFTHFLKDNTLNDGSDEGIATMLAGYELEAWDVTRTILEASGAQEGKMWKDAQYVDWLRKKTVPPDTPFTPTSLTTWALQQVGLMHKAEEL